LNALPKADGRHVSDTHISRVCLATKIVAGILEAQKFLSAGRIVRNRTGV
jgi:hypothetical protein